MMLDLIAMLEAQQHMGVENVPPQKSTLAKLTRDRDLRVQTKRLQIQVGITAMLPVSYMPRKQHMLQLRKTCTVWMLTQMQFAIDSGTYP